MQHPFLNFLHSALVPIVCADVAAGAPGHVHLALVSVVAVGALPHQLAVVLYNLDLAVPAADLTVVALGVELGVHDVLVDELHDIEDCLDVALHIGHFYIADGPTGAERLELRLKSQLVKGIDGL